jgi:hypothetical protein
MSTEIEENGLDIDDWEASIYRVLPIKYFRRMITKKELVLVRPTLWRDPFENFFLKCTVTLPTGELGSMKQIHDKWFGICWTKNPNSDAMWRIYSPKEDGVRISTTVRKLFSAIYNLNDRFRTLKYFIGTVRYRERTEIEDFLERTSFMDLAFGGRAHGFARTLCIKRVEFNHEREIRLLFQDVSKRPRIRDRLRLRFNYATVLDQVTLDPRLDPSDFEARKRELIGLGCTLPIDQSDLYKIETKTIKIE